jgi:hypothetical protein
MRHIQNSSFDSIFDGRIRKESRVPGKRAQRTVLHHTGTQNPLPTVSSMYALIKNIIKFSSYIGKFRVEQLQSHIWGRAYYEEMRKYFPIYEEAVSHIW